MNLPSQWMEQAVNAFAKLPGIGKKTALRLVLHLLKQKKEDVDIFAAAMLNSKRIFIFVLIVITFPI